MFLRATKRLKDGKVHHCWSMVENVRVGRRVFQRRALYLGELNDSQRKGGKSELNVVIEVKDVEKGADLHNGEAMKIRCAEVFYEMPRKDGIDVRYEKQLKNQKLADIIA